MSVLIVNIKMCQWSYKMHDNKTCVISNVHLTNLQNHNMKKKLVFFLGLKLVLYIQEL